MSGPDQQRASMTVLRIIWICLMIALCVYVLVANLVAPGMHEEGYHPEYIPVVRIALGFMAVILLSASVFVRRHFIHKIETGQSEFPNQTYLTGVIISLTLAENVAIFGLVLKLLGDPTDLYYLFILASAFFLFLHRPQEHQLTESIS